MKKVALIAGALMLAGPIAGPVAGQSINFDDLPENDPVFIPVPSQDRDDDGGSIFREVQPVPLPDRNGDGGGFIDRAFGTGNQQGETLPRDGGFSPDWFDDDSDTAEGEDGEDETTMGRRRFKEAPTRTTRLFGPSLPSALPQDQTVPAEGGELRRLDKMTGQSETVAMKAGETAELGRLRVAMDACRKPAGSKGRGTMAYLRIWDEQVSDSEPVFAGWMFAESPALSAMDHPRFDVWVLTCEDATAEAPAAEEQG